MVNKYLSFIIDNVVVKNKLLKVMSKSGSIHYIKIEPGYDYVKFNENCLIFNEL